MISYKNIQTKLNLYLFALLTITLIFPSCTEDMPLKSINFDYAIHNGQTISTLPYAGYHANDFSAKMDLEELENGNTMITITLSNTINGESYHMHAHDSADSNMTPNGTPYNESPNCDVFIQVATGNGGTVSVSQESKMSYDELLNEYSGFFVIHDPLQAVSTTDITSYLVVGGFARTQTDIANLASSTSNYEFNTGQVAEVYAYAGTHPSNLASSIQVDELVDGRSRVTIRIINTLDGEIYHTHAHDMADPSTTPNGTPYEESPNGSLFAMPIQGNGGLAAATNISEMSYNEITTNYDGFFVIHDPLQNVTTVDPSTYVILGIFAR